MYQSNGLFHSYIFIYLFIYYCYTFREIFIDIPDKVRNNGTLYLHVVVYPTNKNRNNLQELVQQMDSSVLSMRLTKYFTPQYKAFNLLNDETETHTEQSVGVPIPHIKKKITVIMLTDRISYSTKNLPYEVARLMRLNNNGHFMPIVQEDFLKTRVHDLEPVYNNSYNTTINITYNPCSIGWLRFVLQVENALGQLLKIGFTAKDIDEVKRIFSETNVYLLCVTMFIGSVHVSYEKSIA